MLYVIRNVILELFWGYPVQPEFWRIKTFSPTILGYAGGSYCWLGKDKIKLFGLAKVYLTLNKNTWSFLVNDLYLLGLPPVLGPIMNLDGSTLDSILFIKSGASAFPYPSRRIAEFYLQI